MGDVNGVSKRDPSAHHMVEDHYTAKDDPSTDEAATEIMHDAGVKGEVHLGSAATLADVHERNQNKIGPFEVAHGAAAAGDVGLAVYAGEGGGIALAEAGSAVLGAPLSLVAAGFALHEMNKEVEEQHDAARDDQVKAGIVFSLKLPGEFKEAQLDRVQVRPMGHNLAQRFEEQAKIHPEKGAVLQRHCDEGIAVAGQLLDAGMRRDDFFAANPKIAARYASDYAFKQGIDATYWAHDHAAVEPRDAPSIYRQLVNEASTRLSSGGHINYGQRA